ncbi:MAG: hypothetical protein KDD61_12960 [Bdellovibrionales bacterium]|nr:hypothetical protein [Bdellovibrionales bacterium]
MNWIKRLGIITFISVLGVVPVFYNSCSSDHEGGSGMTSLSKASGCSLDNYFGATFQPFLVENCGNCHNNGGSGQGAFADQNLQVAWEAFEIVGFSKIASNAKNPSHQPPYTGSHLDGKVNDLLIEWSRAEEERAKCLGGGDTSSDPVDVSTWILSRSKAISAVDDKAVTVSWKLDQELMHLPEDFPDLKGAIFSIKVETGNALNLPYYKISQPTLNLKGATFDLTVRGVKIRINGKFVDGETTFTYLERGVRRGEGTGVSLSSGALVAMGELRSSDVIGVAFGELDTTDLPPPPAPSEVSFTVANQTASREGGTVALKVRLSAPVSSHAVTVGLEVDGTTDATAISSDRTIRNGDGDTVTIKNYDWDYKVDKMSLVFLPNEVEKTVTVTIADDDRYEIKAGSNEKVVLRLGTVSGAIKGAASKSTIVIPDDDPVVDPNSEVLRFSQLMSPGGVLYDECLACHNSQDKRGGYDLTDYKEMIDHNVLIPGDVNSKMFVRMNVEAQNTDTMPLTGLLPTHMRKEVEKWIADGAKNN